MARVYTPDGTIVEMADGSAINFLGGARGGSTPWNTVQTGPALFSNPVANSGAQMLMPVLAQMLGIPDATFNPSYSGAMKSSYVGSLSQRYTTPQYLEFQRYAAQEQGGIYGAAAADILGNLSWSRKSDRDERKARLTEAGRSIVGQAATQLAASMPMLASAMGGNFDSAQQTIWAGAERAAMMQTGPGHLKWGSDPSRTSAMLGDISKRAFDTIAGLAYGDDDASGGYSIAVDDKGRPLPKSYQANRLFGFKLEEVSAMYTQLQTQAVGTPEGEAAFADLDKPGQQRVMLAKAEHLGLVRDLSGDGDLTKAEAAIQALTGGMANRMDPARVSAMLQSLTAAAAAIGEDGTEFINSVLKMQQDLGSSIGMSMTGNADAFRNSKGQLDMGFTSMAASTRLSGHEVARSRGDLTPEGVKAATEDVARAASVTMGSSMAKMVTYLNAKVNEGRISEEAAKDILSSRSTQDFAIQWDRVAAASGTLNASDSVKFMSNDRFAQSLIADANVDMSQVQAQMDTLRPLEIPQRRREIAQGQIRESMTRTAGITGISMRGADLDAAEFEAIKKQLKARNIKTEAVEAAFSGDGIGAARAALSTVAPEYAADIRASGTAGRAIAYHALVLSKDPKQIGLRAGIKTALGLRDPSIDTSKLNEASAFLDKGDLANASRMFDEATKDATGQGKAAIARSSDLAVGAVKGNLKAAETALDAMQKPDSVSVDLDAMVNARLPRGQANTVKDMLAGKKDYETLLGEVEVGAGRVGIEQRRKEYRELDQRIMAFARGEDTTLLDVLGLKANLMDEKDLSRVSEFAEDPEKLKNASDADLSGFVDKKLEGKMKVARKMTTAATAASEAVKSASEAGVKSREASAADDGQAASARGRGGTAGFEVRNIKGTLTIIGRDGKSSEALLSGEDEGV